ncbi:MAG: hypothetical protein HYY17_05215 [Planctomycetes bacterium]|nr:hypothetical protein [Planctomycetota bacterium]
MTGKRSAVPAVTDPVEAWADWIELLAMKSKDRNSSIEDAVRVIRRSGGIDACTDHERRHNRQDEGSDLSQSRAESAFAEIEDRWKACGGDTGEYPFDVAANYIELRGRFREAPHESAYLFLLLLSVQGVKAGPRGVGVEKLFEEVCATAAESYFGGAGKPGRAVSFGHPRRGLPSNFQRAVDSLCALLGEGGGSKPRPTASKQRDGKLDVVAWMDFADRRPGKVVGFGQCAAGRSSWQSKLNELDPGAFCKKWLRDGITVDPVRLFFVPWRIGEMEWSDTAIDGGVLFDRCRIAFHARSLDAVVRSQSAKWTKSVLAQVARA